METKSASNRYWLFALMTFAFVAISIVFSNDETGLAINLITVSLMAAVILKGMGKIERYGIEHLIEASNSLSEASTRIRELAAAPDSDVERLLEATVGANLFEQEFLNQAYSEHRSELNRLHRYRSEFRYVDIGEYFNEGLLNQIANSQYNDLVPGTMTGMGILGTFVGLMFGLQDFDPSSAETMMQTIPPLIDGIKIAFLTSIFGVLYSLVFNLVYRSASEAATNGLDLFLATYYKYVLPRPENDGFTKLIQYQQRQADSMSNFAEQLSLSMAQALGGSVIPTFERIETAIEELADQIAHTQDQNMERIATEFIHKLDALMGDQMAELGERIIELSEIQQTAANNMKETARQITEAGGSLGMISEKLSDSVGAMAGYMQGMEEMQTGLRDAYTGIVSQFAEVGADVQKQHEIMLDILGLEEQSMQSMHQMQDMQKQRLEEERQAISQYHTDMEQFFTNVQTNMQQSTSRMLDTMNASIEGHMDQLRMNTEEMQNAHNQIIEEFRTCCEDICESMDTVSIDTADHVDKTLQLRVEQINDTMTKIDEAQRLFVTQMLAASEKLTRSSNQISSASADLTTNLDKAMSHTYQEIDRQLAEIVRHLSGTITDIREITEKVPHMLSISTEQMQESTAEYLERLNQTQQDLLDEFRNLLQQDEG